jgi:hypothetical protein
LASSTSPGGWIVMTVEQLVERMSGRGNQSTKRKSAQWHSVHEIPYDLTQD